MLSKALLSRILDDEAMTRSLGDAEARILVEWLVERAEALARTQPADSLAVAVERLCRRGRVIGRFVSFWFGPGTRGSAIQLAGAERFDWPLPSPNAEPYEVMGMILHFETERPGARHAA